MSIINMTDGYITGCASEDGIVISKFNNDTSLQIKVSSEIINNLEKEKIGFYKYENGQAVFDEEKYNAFQSETLIKDLRIRRENECFSIINRGQLWYNTLTEQQITGLNTWYQAWLEVTETKVIPTKPNWLK